MDRRRSVGRPSRPNGKAVVQDQVPRSARLAASLAEKVDAGLIGVTVATTADVLNDEIAIKKANSAFSGIGKLAKLMDLDFRYGDGKTAMALLAS